MHGRQASFTPTRDKPPIRPNRPFRPFPIQTPRGGDGRSASPLAGHTHPVGPHSRGGLQIQTALAVAVEPNEPCKATESWYLASERKHTYVTRPRPGSTLDLPTPTHTHKTKSQSCVILVFGTVHSQRQHGSANIALCITTFQTFQHNNTTKSFGFPWTFVQCVYICLSVPSAAPLAQAHPLSGAIGHNPLFGLVIPSPPQRGKKHRQAENEA